MNRRFSLLALLMAVAVMFAVAPVSKADTISIGLQQAGVNGGNITTVATGDGIAGTTGLTPYGTFTVNQVSAQGTATGGTTPQPEPNLLTGSINTSSAASGTLTIWITENGLTAPILNNQLISGFTANDSTFQTLTENTYIDANNGLYTGGTLLASQTFTGPIIGLPQVGSSQNGVPALSGPYSETVEYIVTVGSGGGNSNGTIDINAVPEPGSMLLFGTGLSGLAAALRRRVKK